MGQDTDAGSLAACSKEWIDALVALAQVERKSTQGEWIIREMGRDFFIEKPRKKGEAYGTEIMSDDEYGTKRADAEFIVAAKNLARKVCASIDRIEALPE